MKRFAGSLVLASAVAITGCSTINPYTGEKQTSKATSGAAIGAVAETLPTASAENADNVLIPVVTVSSAVLLQMLAAAL